MSINNDLSAAIVNITIPQGSDCQEFFKLYQDEAQTVPVDLTDFTASGQVRNTFDSKVLLTLSSSDQSIMVGAKIENNIITPDDPINGGLAIFYNNADTTLLKFTGSELECVRDIEISDGITIRRIIQGTLIISREVTR